MIWKRYNHSQTDIYLYCTSAFTTKKIDNKKNYIKIVCTQNKENMLGNAYKSLIFRYSCIRDNFDKVGFCGGHSTINNF